MQQPEKVALPPNQSILADTERGRLFSEVRALAGATLQKLWLPSAQVCVLQLRVPGRTLLAVLDARLALLALADERPTAPESAPKSQATLRAALTGAHLEGARLEIADDTPSRRAPSVRLRFLTDQGPRALIAEEGAALILLGPGERILWASGGAGVLRRPGGTYPPAREVEVAAGAPLENRAEVVRAALRDEEASGLEARRRELIARLKARAGKLRRTLAAVEADAVRAAAAGAARTQAELLLPHQGRIPRGAREARVPDWSRTDEEGKPAEVVLALDPALGAAENAARWLKKAKRYLAAGGRIAARRAEVEEEVRLAEAALLLAATAKDASALAALAPAVPQKRDQQRSKETPRLPYRAFRTEAGATILVGRSARDNDALTMKIARGNDLWLHARGLQGSHVVIPGAGESPDQGTLGDAALLALHFSSARGEELAEVAWTRCKYVRKPKGAPAGSVTFSQEKTLRVRQDPERLAALLRGES